MMERPADRRTNRTNQTMHKINFDVKWVEEVSKPVQNLFAMFKVREYLARSKMKKFTDVLCFFGLH